MCRGIKGPTSHFINQHALNWVVEGLRRLPRIVGGPHHGVVRRKLAPGSSPAGGTDFALAYAKPSSVHLLLPKEHATLLVPDEGGVLEPHVPSMRVLQQVRLVVWNSLAARTWAHMLLAGACEVVPLGTVHHGPTHRDLLRARNGRLPTMQVMRRGRQKITRTVIPVLRCILCGGPEEDTGHMHMLCERDEVVARLLCAKVEEFVADLPLADRAMEFMSWKEHGCTWTESRMTGVVPGELKLLFAAVRAASSWGPAKAKIVPGGHDPNWGGWLRPEKSSACQGHATAAARSQEGCVCILAR